jgi:putrescine transport system substrate-binding protein
MKRLVPVAALTALTLLAACGGEKDSAKTLNVYNWSDYIDPEILKDFEKETGVKVVYDTFDSNEVQETKVLTGGTGYDIVTPSNDIVPRFIQAKAIQPLDKARLTGLGNLWPEVMRHMEPFDPGQRYSVPYMWGTIGIGYNKEAIAQRLPGVTIDSWAVALEPKNLAKLQDCGVYYLDAASDMYAVTLKYLGKDPNTKSEADYAAATAQLLKARPYVRKFHSSEYIDALANGDICLAVGYSGDILQAASDASDAKAKHTVEYVIPKEGTQVWFDVFAIPADAKHVDNAYRFLDYMLRPEVIAKASNFTQYANANLPSQAKLDSEVRNNPNVYPTPEVFNRLFVSTTKDQEQLRVVNRDWTRVQTGK